VSVLPDARIASGSADNTLRVWDAASGACECVLEGHTEYVICVSVLPDGRVVSGSYDKTLRVWDAARGACERVVQRTDADYASLNPAVRADRSAAASAISLDHSRAVLTTNAGRIHLGSSVESSNAVAAPDLVLVAGTASGLVAFAEIIPALR